MNKKLTCSWLCLALVLLAGATALAADGITLTQDGRIAIVTKPNTQVVRPVINPPWNTTIGGNLSTYPFGTFFCCYGNTIAGINSALGFEVWVAIPFTPSKNMKVVKLDSSVGYIENTDTHFLLSVYTDDNGVPGTALATFASSANTQFGSCCTLSTGHSKTGVSVESGKQYWEVVQTDDKHHPSFFGAWAFNSTDMRLHPAAFWCKTTGSQCGSNNGKWVPTSGTLLPAFAVRAH